MNNIVSIQQPSWTNEELINNLEEFANIYQNRPIKDNSGGMKSPHMFYFWFLLKKLQPQAIIESGVFQGQGTWLIEQVCPSASLYCIEPNQKQIKYKSSKAKYFKKDFSQLDFSNLPKDQTLLFFDDHQNAYERIKLAKWLGFKQLVFDDNYPISKGDCYSLKKAFAHAGFNYHSYLNFKEKIKVAIKEKFLSFKVPETIEANSVDAKYLYENIDIYYEFPPIFKTNNTRWQDFWDESIYPTPKALLNRIEHDYQNIYLQEAQAYTWMCYVKLK